MSKIEYTKEREFLASIYANGDDLIEVTIDDTDFISLEELLVKHREYVEAQFNQPPATV